jgi:uncharacterized damage-inducible protein DinB
MALHDLIGHKGHADAALLNAIARHQASREDAELQRLLHHVLVSNRFWLLSILGEPFVAEVETHAPESFTSLAAGFRTTHERELTWLAGSTEAALGEWLENSLIPGGKCVVSNALLQVCLHAQGHRSQCAQRLRALGGTPPATDFILWLVDRPAPAWPS